MITAENVSFLTGECPIIDKLSIQIKPALMTAIVGPNGSGKTTLMKLLSGSISPHKGAISMEDTPLAVWDVRALGKQRAMLYQETHLDFDFTVREVVTLGRSPHMKGSETIKDHDIVDQALALLKIESLANRSFPTLSGGEKQRTQIARVIAQILEKKKENRYLLLDEPLNNLDPNHCHFILKILKELTEQGLGIAIILHDLNLARLYCQRAILLNKGKVIASGLVSEVIPSPALEKAFHLSFSLTQDDPQQLLSFPKN